MVFGCRRVILYLELGIGVWVEPIEFLLFEWVFCVEPDDLCEVEVGAYNNAHRNSGKDHIYVLFALINKYLPVYQVRQCRQKHKWLQKPGNESHLGVKEHVFVIAMSPDSERPSYNIYEEKSVEQVNQASGPPVAQAEATTAPRGVKVLLENVFLLAFCISACKELLVLILHYFKVFRDFFYSVFKILHSILLIVTLSTQSIFLVKICRCLRS